MIVKSRFFKVYCRNISTTHTFKPSL